MVCGCSPVVCVDVVTSHQPPLPSKNNCNIIMGGQEKSTNSPISFSVNGAPLVAHAHHGIHF